MRGVASADKGDKCNHKSVACTYTRCFIQRVQNTAQSQQYKTNGVRYTSSLCARAAHIKNG